VWRKVGAATVGEASGLRWLPSGQWARGRAGRSRCSWRHLSASAMCIQGIPSAYPERFLLAPACVHSTPLPPRRLFDSRTRPTAPSLSALWPSPLPRRRTETADPTMEQYLHTGGRSKGEWFPDNIAGLMRASRTECVDDIEFIVGSMPVSAQQAAAAAAAGAGAAGLGEDGEDGDGDDPEAAAAAAAAAQAAAVSLRGGARHNKRKSKYERAADELSVTSTCTLRSLAQHSHCPPSPHCSRDALEGCSSLSPLPPFARDSSTQFLSVRPAQECGQRRCVSPWPSLRLSRGTCVCVRLLTPSSCCRSSVASSARTALPKPPRPSAHA
jgi:hypothetical protein